MFTPLKKRIVDLYADKIIFNIGTSVFTQIGTHFQKYKQDIDLKAKKQDPLKSLEINYTISYCVMISGFNFIDFVPTFSPYNICAAYDIACCPPVEQ